MVRRLVDRAGRTTFPRLPVDVPRRLRNGERSVQLGEIWFGDMSLADRRSMVAGLLDQLERQGFRSLDVTRRPRRLRRDAGGRDAVDTVRWQDGVALAARERGERTWVHLVPHDGGAELLVLVFGEQAEAVWWDLMDAADELLG